MDVHQLELFLTVMNSPSMTRAAEKIHLSPGAVSLQLHNLADELHTELFVRRGKKLIPTPAALRLAEHAKEVLRMMGHIQQLFENDLAVDVRPFHFATGVTTLIYQLGGPFRQLRKRYPKCRNSGDRWRNGGGGFRPARSPLRFGAHLAPRFRSQPQAYSAV